ncbi:MAG: Holliday junction resolvase RuvX [bacterium]|nr:Holliday junction resolvase RuvX [bacterium]
MSVILSLDVGTKRVGLALTNEEGEFPFPFKTYNRAAGEAESKILLLLEQRGIELVVVGLPLNVKGDKTEQCKDVEKFCRRLSKRSKIKIEFVDEHLSSEEAKERLTEAKGGRISVSDLKASIDAAAAAVILEYYLKQKR